MDPKRFVLAVEEVAFLSYLPLYLLTFPVILLVRDSLPWDYQCQEQDLWVICLASRHLTLVKLVDPTHEYAVRTTLAPRASAFLLLLFEVTKVNLSPPVSPTDSSK
jgi:hypothetical protein